MFVCVYISEPVGLLVDFAYGFSPLIEEFAPDTVVLDIAGCDLLIGRPGSIARKIAHSALKSGYKANVAMAGNPDAAIHAARWLPGITVIPPGEESEYLGSLPLTALCTSLAGIEDQRALAIIETVELWGVRCFRDLAALPEAGISERLGPDGIRLQKLARGTNNRPLIVKEPALGFEKSIELDDPVDLIEPLSFITAGLLNQLCASLQACALATNELQFRLRLEGKAETHRILPLPFPTRDQKVLLKLLLLDIEANPPQAAITGVSIKAEPAKPRVTQHGLFQAMSPEPEKLELTIARIARLVGAHNIGSPEILNTHRPGVFRLRKFRVLRNSSSKIRRLSKPQTKQLSAIGRLERKQGFRVFNPPLQVEVRAPSGSPTRISAKKAINKRSWSVDGKVTKRAGPWRTTGDWWADDSWARDEWDVAIGGSNLGQGLYRIYHDLQSDAWFVEGMYD
jgi:protein ImuB